MEAKTRRSFVKGSLAAGTAFTATGSARWARAQTKPDKLVFVGDNGMWHDTLVKEVAPAFEREHGIRIDFTSLPVDATAARLRSELSAGGTGIDIAQWTAYWAGWITPHLEDHQELLARVASRHPDFDLEDFMPSVRGMATWDGKLSGIPYRVTTGIFHYQKALLEEAGVRPPRTFAELQEAAIACTRAGAPVNRYGLGYLARQGPALFGSFRPYMLSNGGQLYDPRTYEIRVNETPAVEALRYYGDLFTKYHAVTPDSITWEYNETIAGGQNDRFAMVTTLSPYGSLFNNSPNSKTAGKWAWSTVPGATSPDQSRTNFGGWSLAVPKGSRNKEWALEFIMMACNKQWMRRSMELDNAPPRMSVLNDSDMVQRFGWAPAAAEALRTAVLDPQDPIWPTLEQQLRVGISSVLLGQKDAKSALDQVASDWQRSLRRAGLK